MLQGMTLSLEDAKRVAAAARAEAEKNGWNIVIAVVDDGGHLMYLERMDGAQKASSRIAEKKARTAILFKRQDARQSYPRTCRMGKPRGSTKGSKPVSLICGLSATGAEKPR